VKTHTCFQEPVYRSSLDEATVELLLELYYHPYHRRLEAAAGPAIRLGIDCHTMLAEAPPIGPDPGRPRPRICLSNADGTCPRAWLESLASCLRVEFGDDVRLNDPFTGGYITRRHAAELPWMQLEMSRAPFMSYAKKRAAVRSALRVFCEGL
jgi:formiminoglutamase